MSLTPHTQPDCRAIDLSRFRQLVTGQDDSAFPPIDAGYHTAQVKPRIVESWASRGVSGSSPVSSTPGQRPFSRSRERAFFVLRGTLRGKIVSAPFGSIIRGCSKSFCSRYPVVSLPATRYAQLRTVRPLS